MKRKRRTMPATNNMEQTNTGSEDKGIKNGYGIDY